MLPATAGLVHRDVARRCHVNPVDLQLEQAAEIVQVARLVGGVDQPTARRVVELGEFAVLASDLRERIRHRLARACVHEVVP